jgi:hypothetical protein
VVSYYSSVFHRTFDSNFFNEPAISILVLLLLFLFPDDVSGKAAGNRANRCANTYIASCDGSNACPASSTNDAAAHSALLLI